MPIEIKPFDTLFFRNGKPFSMGEEVWAGGMFPPPPSVVYGALRTAYFSQHLEELGEAGQTSDPTKDLRLSKLLIRKGEEVFFPCPYDVVVEKDDDQAVHLLVPEAGVYDRIASLSPSLRLLHPPDPSIHVESRGGKCFLSANGLADYLEGMAPSPQGLRSEEEFVVPEPKIGIQKDVRTGSSQEGRLYRVGMSRPQESVGLHIEYHGLKGLEHAAFIKLGGEGKAASVAHRASPVNIERPAPEGDLFKLYFATPAVFADGWLPGEQVSDDPMIRQIGQQRMRLVAASTGRAVHLGGFDMAKGHPKRMLRAVPSGSVYYFEALGDVGTSIQALHGTCISDFGLADQGFGLAFTGIIPD